MYKVIQCYEEKGILKEHIVNFTKTFEDAYNDLLDVYKIDMDSFVVILGLEKEAREHFILNILKDKEKDLLTIVSV